MGDPKIAILKNEISKNIINEFDLQLNEVLSVCESEIEKLMLLHLYLYFQKFRENEFWSNKYLRLEFIEDEIILVDDPDISSFEMQKMEERVKKYNYRKFKYGFHKYIGFKVKENNSEPFTLNETKSNSPLIDELVFREFEVRPQYPFIIDDSIEYRLDIAIILNRKTHNGKILESKKVALECDGYDYHSSPQQKRNDDIRTRKLKKSGWKEVLRYSGTELYNLNRQEVHSLFEEIVDVLYI
ncbi:MAG: hypothetical protein JXL97_19405 [Bacteroidales bacterium]|nr:hypothetical protein [Bacteroidales bacterium]